MIFINNCIKKYSAKMESQFANRNSYITINAEKNVHTHTLIFLHGLGDSAEGFEDVFSPGGPLNLQNIKVLLPTAPKSAVTCNGGYKMNSWFDIYNLEDQSGKIKDLISQGKN